MHFYIIVTKYDLQAKQLIYHLKAFSKFGGICGGISLGDLKGTCPLPRRNRSARVSTHSLLGVSHWGGIVEGRLEGHYTLFLTNPLLRLSFYHFPFL